MRQALAPKMKLKLIIDQSNTFSISKIIPPVLKAIYDSFEDHMIF